MLHQAVNAQVEDVTALKELLLWCRVRWPQARGWWTVARGSEGYNAAVDLHGDVVLGSTWRFLMDEWKNGKVTDNSAWGW